MAKARASTAANLGFEYRPWASADKSRGDMGAAIRQNLEALGYGE